MALKQLSTLAAVAALAWTAAGTAQAETILKVHHFLPSGSSFHQ